MLAVIRNRIRSTRKRVPNGFYIGAMPEESLPLATEVVVSFADAHKDGALAVIELGSPVVVMEHKAYVDPELLAHYQRLKKLAEQRDMAVLVVQPSVSSASCQGVWVSDTVDALFEMQPGSEDQATLYYENIYGIRVDFGEKQNKKKTPPDEQEAQEAPDMSRITLRISAAPTASIPQASPVLRVDSAVTAQASLRLLQNLSRLIEQKYQQEQQKERPVMDRKQRREIAEKKQALGLRD